MIVWCRQHGRAHGFVERSPVTGVVQLRYREPRWRNRYAVMAREDSRYNVTWVLSNWAKETVEVGGCRGCGVREIRLAELLTAFEEGRSKISL